MLYRVVERHYPSEVAFQSTSLETCQSVRDTLRRQRDIDFVTIDEIGTIQEIDVPAQFSLNRDNWTKGNAGLHNSTEQSRVTAILNFLKRLKHCEFEKRLGSVYQKGRPDISGCIAGLHFEFEVKKDGQAPTTLQMAILERYARAGAMVAVIRNVDDVKAAFTHYGIDWASMVKEK